MQMFARLKSAGKKAIQSQIIKLAQTKQSFAFGKKPDYADAESWFTTQDGRQIPVLPNHRYSLKKCWAAFGPVAALAELDEKNLLSSQSQAFLKHIIGHRTITEPFETIRDHLAPYLDQHRDLFISTAIPHIGRRLLKPSPAATNAKVGQIAASHTSLLHKIGRIVAAPPQAGEKIMEIGFTSGGESIVAFEKIGFAAIGIDNFYDASIEATSRHHIVTEQTGSKAHFMQGDITQHSGFEDGALAMIYSMSVLEHIANLEAAFAEMFRVLRPGGVMYHHYDPYFYPRGGHSLAVLDSPWAHVRMTDHDLARYIHAYRPHEEKLVMPWIKSALNRMHTQSVMLQTLARAGFQVRVFDATPVAAPMLAQLTTEIMQDCTRINDNLTIADLVSKSVAFIAEKPL